MSGDLKRQLQRGDGHLFFTLFPPPAEFPATPEGIAAFQQMLANAPQVSMVSNVGRLAAMVGCYSVSGRGAVLCPVSDVQPRPVHGRMTLHVNFDTARLPLEQAIPLIADLETGLMRAAGWFSGRITCAGGKQQSSLAGIRPSTR